MPKFETFLPAVKITLVVLLSSSCCVAQDVSGVKSFRNNLDGRTLSAIQEHSKRWEKQFKKYSRKVLSRLRHEEKRLQRIAYAKDSLLAEKVFKEVDRYYTFDSTGSFDMPLIYSGRLDTLMTAMKYLQDKSNPEMVHQVESFLLQINEMQQLLNYTKGVEEVIRQRQQLLLENFSHLETGRAFSNYKQLVDEYGGVITDFRISLNQPGKLEARLTEELARLPEFQDFFARNSQLGRAFALPDVTVAALSLQGLQTRSGVSALLESRFGEGADVTEILGQNLQQAQEQLAELKVKPARYARGEFGTAGNSAEMPDFKPNGQITKPFLKRLETGYNLQSQSASWYFPVTTDIGLSLGYKLNDKSIVGIGASYKIGWGRGWDRINITHQGMALRTFLDYKLKGNFLISGGYEMNYRSVFRSIEELKEYSAWQRSGLVGIGREIKLKEKARCQARLLWDFLSYRQLPKTPAIVWRVSYTLK